MDYKQKIFTKLSEQIRTDSVYSTVTGMGTSADKLSQIRPSFMTWAEIDLLYWYMSVDFISKPINFMAEEMYREAFTVDTGNDSYDKIIKERLETLDAYNKFIQHEKEKRIYRKGSILFLACTDNDSLSQIDLTTPLTKPTIQSINVIPAYEFTISQGVNQPTKAFYNNPEITIGTYSNVHKSRYYWSCNNYQAKFLQGVSLVESLIEIGSALDIGVWSLSNMLYESSVKVVKSNSIKEAGKSVIEAIRDKIKSVLNTQSVLILGESESFEKQNLTTSGINDIMTFLWEVESFKNGVGINVLKGQHKRVISMDKDPELVSLYSKIEQAQESASPYINTIVDAVLLEQGIKSKYEIKWEKLYILDDNTQADINLKNAQIDQIYQTIGVKNQEDIMAERFPEIQSRVNEMLAAQGQ